MWNWSYFLFYSIYWSWLNVNTISCYLLLIDNYFPIKFSPEDHQETVSWKGKFFIYHSDQSSSFRSHQSQLRPQGDTSSELLTAGPDNFNGWWNACRNQIPQVQNSTRQIPHTQNFTTPNSTAQNSTTQTHHIQQRNKSFKNLLACNLLLVCNYYR